MGVRCGLVRAQTQGRSRPGLGPIQDRTGETPVAEYGRGYIVACMFTRAYSPAHVISHVPAQTCKGGGCPALTPSAAQCRGSDHSQVRTRLNTRWTSPILCYRLTYLPSGAGIARDAPRRPAPRTRRLGRPLLVRRRRDPPNPLILGTRARFQTSREPQNLPRARAALQPSQVAAVIRRRSRCKDQSFRSSRGSPQQPITT